jgi:hypothetical protein
MPLKDIRQGPPHIFAKRGCGKERLSLEKTQIMGYAKRSFCGTIWMRAEPKP